MIEHGWPAGAVPGGSEHRQWAHGDWGEGQCGRGRWSRRSFLAAVATAGGVAATGGLGGVARAAAIEPPADWDAIAEDVRAEFVRTYTAYKTYAWGHDELLPRTASAREFFATGRPVGLTIIESLDTLYLMELDGELDIALDWIEHNLSFDIDASFQVFEAIIRLVGGLLSGYHATGERMLLDKARDLADRLLPAFEQSRTGAPWRFVNLQTGAVSGRYNFLAEIGTNITEFGDLGQLVGDDRYYRASKRAFQAVVDRRSRLDLVGTTMDITNGAWVDLTASINPPVDSFYEYLWDGWDVFGDADLLRWYKLLTDAIVARMAETYGGNLWFKRVNHLTGKLKDRHQSELASFYAGLLGQSGYRQLGAAYHDSWTAVLDRWELPPEDIDYSTMAVLSAGNQLRPEYVDAAFMLWLTTGQELYRLRAYDFYLRQKRNSQTPNGWTIITDVTTSPMVQGNLTSGYWYSEQMKYWYLMFRASPRFDYAHNYLTTEGNVLRGLR